MSIGALFQRKIHTLVILGLIATLTACGGGAKTDNQTTSSNAVVSSSAASINTGVSSSSQASDPISLSRQAEIEDAELAYCIDNSPAKTLEELKTIVCDAKNVTSLKGLEHFVNLEDISIQGPVYTEYDEDGGAVKRLSGALDFSSFANLRSLNLQNNYHITAVDISKNSKLVFLNVGHNSIQHLYVSHLENLEILHAQDNFLTTINFSEKNSKLTLLNLGDDNPRRFYSLLHSGRYGNPLISVDTSFLPELKVFYAQYLLNPADFDFSKNTQLTELYATTNGLTFTEGSALKILALDYTADQLDLSNLSQLQKLDISTRAQLKFSVNNIGLKEISISKAKVDGIDYSLFPHLEVLNLTSITTMGNPLNFSSNSELKTLIIDGVDESPVSMAFPLNLLTLSVSGVSSLENLGFLDLSSLSKLTSLKLERVPITSLSLPVNNQLKTIDIQYSNIANLDFSQSNNLTDLNVSFCSNLTVVNFLEDNLNLETLALNETAISELNLAFFPSLKKLSVEKTQIKSLDFSKNKSIQSVSGINGTINSITGIEVYLSKSALLDFRNNPLSHVTNMYFEQLVTVNGFSNLLY